MLTYKKKSGTQKKIRDPTRGKIYWVPEQQSGTQQEGNGANNNRQYLNNFKKSAGFLNNNQGPNKREIMQTTIDNILTIGRPRVEIKVSGWNGG